MKKQLLAAAVLAIGISALSTTQAQEEEAAEPASRHAQFDPVGVWFARTRAMLGGGAEGRIDAILVFNRDGTVSQDTTAETGANPLFPVVDATPLEGLWRRKGRVVEAAQLSLVENCPPPAPQGFGILRLLGNFEIVGPDAMVGIGGALDCIPCDIGAFGEPDCPDVTALKFPEAGPPIGDVQLRRFRPFKR